MKYLFLLALIVLSVSSLSFADSCGGFTRPPMRKGLGVVDPDGHHDGKISEVYANRQVKISFFILSEVISYDRVLFSVSSCNGVREGMHAYLPLGDGGFKDLGIVDAIYSDASIKTDLYSAKHHDYGFRYLRDVVTPVRCDGATKICRGQAVILEKEPGHIVEVLNNGYGLFEPSSWLGAFNEHYVKLASPTLRY